MAGVTEHAEGAPERALDRPSVPRARGSFDWSFGGRRPLIEAIAALAVVAVSLRYLIISIHAAATTSLWTDELYSILNYSGEGPVTAATKYDVANNHIFFNLINALTPGAGSVDPLRARIWSIVAVLAMGALILYEFGRRRWYLAGALLFAVFAVNQQWLDLALQARGYGLIGLCATAASLWTWRYLEERRRRWLVGLAVASLIGIWSVPIFVAFVGPLWLLVLATVRSRRVAVIGAITAAVIVLVHLPVAGAMYRYSSSYSKLMGEQFTSGRDVARTIFDYLLDNVTNPVVLLLWTLGGAVTGVVMLPGRSDVPRPIRDTVRVLVGSIGAFFVLCLVLRTALSRTTAFVVVPIAVAVAVSVAAISSDHPNRLWRRGAAALMAVAALVACIHGWAAADAFTFVPIENWKAAATYIDDSFPDDTTVYSTLTPEYLEAYLGRHRVVAKLDPQAFAAGKQVVVDFEVNRPSHIDEKLDAATRDRVETDFAQVRGHDDPHGAIRVLSALPALNPVDDVTVEGKDQPALIDGDLSTTLPISGFQPQGSPVVIDISVDPTTSARALVVAVGGDSSPAALSAEVHDSAGDRSVPASAITRAVNGTVTIELGDTAVDRVRIFVAPATQGLTFEPAEIWVYAS